MLFPLFFLLALRGICASIKSHLFLMSFFHLVCLDCGICMLFLASSGFSGHWIWQSFHVLPTRTARGSPVLARGACLYRASCAAGVWIGACLPLKRQQWHLMTWKVLCKPSVFSVFRNGTVCCVQKVSPVLSWESCVEQCLKPCQGLPQNANGFRRKNVSRSFLTAHSFGFCWLLLKMSC